jgi:hypothetical protein
MEVTNTTAGQASSADMVRELVRMVDGLANQVKRWQEMQSNAYSETIESLESRVGEIGGELDSIASRIKGYDEAFEHGSRSSLDDTEIPVLEHLAFRVAHLEKWVTQLDDKFKKDASLARKQFFISLGMLGAAAAFLIVAIWQVVGG